MRKQDQLINLIHSLTKGERKFFVQNNRTSATDKSYLRLYELLLKKESYNTDELCKLLKKSKAELANEKKYLEKSLMSALRNYHQDNPHIAILNKIADSIILIEKQLPEIAISAVKSSIDAAATAQLHPLLFHSHGLMLTLCSDPFASFVSAEQAAEHHLEKMKEAAMQMQLTVDFELLNSKVFGAYIRRKRDVTEAHKKETRALLKNKLLHTDYESSDLTSYKYNLLSILYLRLGDVESNLEINQKCLELYESQTEIDTMGYWNALYNVTQSIIVKGNKKEFVDWMKKLESRYYYQYPVDTDYLDKLLNSSKAVFMAGGYCQLLMKKEMPHGEVRAFTKNFIQNFNQNKKAISGSHFISAVFKVAVCCFIMGDIDDCTEILNMLFNEVGDTENKTAVNHARLLYVMAHAELGNYSLLPGLVQSCINYLKKHDQYGKTEKLILKHFNELARTTKKAELKVWFTEFEQTLNTLRQNRETSLIFELLPYELWVEGRV